MLQISIHGEVITRLDDIPRKLRQAFGEKFEELIGELHAKALANFPGASGADVSYGVDHLDETTLIGYIEPRTPKTIAQEFGGKGWYAIEVGGKGFLANKKDTSRYPSGFFSKVGVLHPPMVGKHYILDTLEREMPWLESELENIRVQL